MGGPPLHLLRAALGFLCALLLTNWLAGALGLRWTATGSNRHLQILHHFLTSEDQPAVVFFGTSMTRHAFPSQVLEQALAERGVPGAVWNLGLPGASAPIALPLVTEVLDMRTTPRLLVLEASAFFWNEARPGSGAEMYWRWFAPLGEVARQVGEQPFGHTAAAIRRQVWGAEALWRWPQFRLVGENRLHLADLRESHGGVFTPRVYRALEQGIWPPRVPRPPDVPLEQAMRGFEPLRFGDSWSETLARLAAACDSRSIELLVVDLPLRPDLAEALDPAQQDAFRAWLRQRCELAGVAWVSLPAPLLPEAEQGAEPRPVFLDPMHLSPEAAAVFARRFAEEQLAPRLIG
ncbi:MAG: hypothetical protein H8E31_13785 [Planctomycetes bacterium]|nr:hypothetical protein [Planctomycetota bacterium]